jgi:hypothetical protein
MAARFEDVGAFRSASSALKNRRIEGLHSPVFLRRLRPAFMRTLERLGIAVNRRLENVTVAAVDSAVRELPGLCPLVVSGDAFPFPFDGIR